MIDSVDSDWLAYYQRVARRPVNGFFRSAVKFFDHPGVAIDLGCGPGIETIDLLNRGWQVTAIDQEQAAMDFIKKRLSPDHEGQIGFQISSFETLEIPAADFIWAGLSLPFCAPAEFPNLWVKILAALTPGGRFAGDFFGHRHAWSNNNDMTFHTRSDVEALMQSLQIEYLQEGEGERQTTFEGVIHWHMISVQARKEG